MNILLAHLLEITVPYAVISLGTINWNGDEEEISDFLRPDDIREHYSTHLRRKVLAIIPLPNSRLKVIIRR